MGLELKMEKVIAGLLEFIKRSLELQKKILLMRERMKKEDKEKET